jgi:hypothetical protein
VALASDTRRRYGPDGSNTALPGWWEPASPGTRGAGCASNQIGPLHYPGGSVAFEWCCELAGGRCLYKVDILRVSWLDRHMEETSGTTHHICTEYYNATSDDRWNRCGDQIDYDAGDVLPDLATEAL